MEARADRHRADAQHGRGIAGPRGRRLVADLQIESRNGVRIILDDLTGNWREKTRASLFADRKLAEALDRTLTTIRTRYGHGTANAVAMQLEYAGSQ